MKKDLLFYKIIAVFLIITVSFLYVNQARASILFAYFFFDFISIILIDYFTCTINILWGGCGGAGGGGGVTGEIQVDVKVNDSDGPIALQAPADYILKWSATNVSACTATWAEGEIGPQGTVQYSGVSDIGRFFYTLTCSGVSDTVIVDIIGPQVNLFGPTEVLIPDSLYINWTSQNVSSCSATSSPSIWTGSKPLQGPETIYSETNINNRGTYDFTLICSDDNNNSASDNHTATVIQVPRCSFAADSTSIILPQSSTLSWSCKYADTCSIDQGIGSVSNVFGTKDVRPPETTTYTLTCSGLDGSRSYQATVNVGFTPRLREVIPR